MPRLYLEQFLQQDYDRGLMTEAFRQIEDAINRLSEGRIYQNYNAGTSEPTGDAQAYQLGDVVRNTAPTPTGTPEFVLWGWVCVASGAPGTWRELRIPTGN